MLDGDAAGIGFLDSPPSRVAADLLASHPGALTPAERVCDYQVRYRISIGGMGEVYLAENIYSHQPVALKLVRPHLIADPRIADRFASEARAAGALHHPNVVAIYEFGKSEAGMFIAMEWVDGQTWRALMSASEIPLPIAGDWSRQAAHALAAAHQAGVIHRDIKPDNIMLSNTGAVKILDFGLARLGANVLPDVEASGASGTISGTLSGTLPYMSPELLRGERASSASDVFSFGSVLYELFTGRHPFAGETPLDVFEAIECRTPDSPSSRRAGIPPALDGLLLAMLAGEQERRPSSALVAAELDRIIFDGR
jgi:serine/threonine-protein kinase